MEEDNLILLIVSFVLLLLIMVLIMFTLFTIYHKRKQKMLIEKEESKRLYEKQLALSKVEMQEETLKNISQELHDNIGQLLSVTKMQLNMIKPLSDLEDNALVSDSRATIDSALSEVRQLSRLLNTDYIKFSGLLNSVKIETERINRMKYIKVNYKVEGNPEKLKEKDEIILFRIVQELISNVIKHSKARNLNVWLTFTEIELEIIIEDDGIGMSEKNQSYGLGYNNLISRAQMLKSNIIFTNKSTGGLHVKIIYPLKN